MFLQFKIATTVIATALRLKIHLSSSLAFFSALWYCDGHQNKAATRKSVGTYLHSSQKLAGGQKNPEYETPKYISAFPRIILDSSEWTTTICVIVDIESFWTEGYAGQTPNSGHELAICVL